MPLNGKPPELSHRTFVQLAPAFGHGLTVFQTIMAVPNRNIARAMPEAPADVWCFAAQITAAVQIAQPIVSIKKLSLFFGSDHVVALTDIFDKHVVPVYRGNYF